MVSTVFGRTISKPKNVRLRLHEVIAHARATIHAQFARLRTGVGFHRFHDVIDLEGDTFQRGAGKVAVGGAAGDAEESAARVRIPVRRAEAGQRRDEINTTLSSTVASEGD